MVVRLWPLSLLMVAVVAGVVVVARRMVVITGAVGILRMGIAIDDDDGVVKNRIKILEGHVGADMPGLEGLIIVVSEVLRVLVEV